MAYPFLLARLLMVPLGLLMLSGVAAVSAEETDPFEPGPPSPNVTYNAGKPIYVELTYREPGIPPPGFVGPVPPTTRTVVTAVPAAEWGNLPTDITEGSWEIYWVFPNEGNLVPTNATGPRVPLPILVPDGLYPGDGTSGTGKKGKIWVVLPIGEVPGFTPPRSGDQPMVGDEPVIWLGVPVIRKAG